MKTQVLAQEILKSYLDFSFEFLLRYFQAQQHNIFHKLHDMHMQDQYQYRNHHRKHRFNPKSTDFQKT